MAEEGLVHTACGQRGVRRRDGGRLGSLPAAPRSGAPAEARRLAERLEIHHTPKHGSRLNLAEIELSVLARQCLDERMENQDKLARAVAAWERTRNQAAVRLDWRFTTADARIKLNHLYPTILP